MRALPGFTAPFSLVLALATPTAAAPCQFVLGFKTLHDLMPNAIGDCLVDKHHNPANGVGCVALGVYEGRTVFGRYGVRRQGRRLVLKATLGPRLWQLL